MEVIQGKDCVFADSLEIDLDYEFDVAKFFDFTHFETPEEIAEAERWFDFAAGYLPSPFIAKGKTDVDDLADSVTSSSRYGSEYTYSIDNDSLESPVSSADRGKKGPQLLRSKSMSSPRSNFLVNSRLLQPTASHLAKQNIHKGVHSKRAPRRFQKPGNPVKSPSDADATKRQKLEVGYLRKVSQLKHQTSFSHKSSKEIRNTDVNSSHDKPKVTVPKEPDLATAIRALRPRSNHAPLLRNDPRYNSSSSRARSLNGKIQEAQTSVQSKNKITTPLPHFQDKDSCGGMIANGRVLELRRTNSCKVDQGYSFRARSLNKKIFSSKGEIGVSRNCKMETTVPKEFKLSSSRKLPQNPPTELFNKLSLIPKKNPTLPLEEHPLQLKVLKKNASFSNINNENKNASAINGKSKRCCGNGGRMITGIQNRLTRVRSLIR